MKDSIMKALLWLDDIMYYPILIVVLALAGIYFSLRLGFIQIRWFPESLRVVKDRPAEEGGVSSFQALMVSTASRVGTGNIVGVSTAICLGGPGAVFWMWVLALLGGATAFVESTLAQIYKNRDEDGSCYGGPAYYIEKVYKSHFAACLFIIFLIMTYAVGFNMLCSYNLQSTFAAYSWYHPKVTPMIIGGILAALIAIVLLGGGKRIVHVTEVIVPFMGLFYVLISLVVIVVNFKNLPGVFGMIFADAFDFKSMAGGFAGSCLIYGIKRGLYSNEAGVGSAPNAAASAEVSHPVKQGLVQCLSVYIDTLLLCTATALMCLASGIPGNDVNAGAPYVQEAIASVFGKLGPMFITGAMLLFAFTTLIGNLYYVQNGVAFLNDRKMPGKSFMTVFHLCCALVVFIGACIPMDAAWAAADITMGFMALMNIPACFALGGWAFKAADDYNKQKKKGLDPVFHAASIGMHPEDLDYWD